MYRAYVTHDLLLGHRNSNRCLCFVYLLRLLFGWGFFYLFIYLFIYLLFYLFIYLFFIYLFIYFFWGGGWYGHNVSSTDHYMLHKIIYTYYTRVIQVIVCPCIYYIYMNYFVVY